MYKVRIPAIQMGEHNHDYGVNNITFFTEKHGFEGSIKRR